MDPSKYTELSKIPALRPPPGVESNFENPSSIGTTIVVVKVVFLVLMFFFLVMRFYVKASITRGLWWDDFFMVLGAMGCFVHSVMHIHKTKDGLGTHQWDLPLSRLTPSFIRVLTAGNIVYSPTVLFVKLSIVLLYFRIFSVDRTMKWFTYGASAFLVVFYVSQTCVAIAVAALCISPPPNPYICSDIYKNTIFQAVVNVATDFAVLSLPIVKVSRLHTSAQRKVGVNAIFAVGLIACVASLIRMIFVIKYAHSRDSTYTGGFLSIFSAVEINAGIIAGCLVALPPLFRKNPVRSFRKWSLSSSWSRLFRRSDQKHASSRKQPSGDSFHGVSLHLPTAGGFTESGNKGTSISERSLVEHEMDRRAAEPLSM